MDPRAKSAVIKEVTFTFNPNGSIGVNGRIQAIKRYREETGASLGDARLVLDKAIIELLSVGALEWVARASFDAGALAQRIEAKQQRETQVQGAVIPPIPQGKREIDGKVYSSIEDLQRMGRATLVRYAGLVGLPYAQFVSMTNVQVAEAVWKYGTEV